MCMHTVFGYLLLEHLYHLAPDASCKVDVGAVVAVVDRQRGKGR
jgi:hypothetical protein